jgi:hypothetical protein
MMLVSAFDVVIRAGILVASDVDFDVVVVRHSGLM